MAQVSLKGRLGKTKSALVVNGKVLLRNNYVLCARQPDRVVEFLYTDFQQQEIYVDSGNEIIEKALLDFDTKYGSLNIPIDAEDIQVTICPYTGCTVITSSIYRYLSNPDRHDLTVHYEQWVRDLLNQFVFDEICNSYELFVRIFNPKLKRGQFPPIIKGHLVAGFYQPLICDTEPLKSALHYPQFKPYILAFMPYSKVMCSARDTTKKMKLNLEVIATADYCKLLGMNVLPRVQSLHFMLAIYYMLSLIMDLRYPVFDENNQLTTPHVDEFVNRNRRIFDSIYGGRNTRLRTWFDEFVAGSNNILRK